MSLKDIGNLGNVQIRTKSKVPNRPDAPKRKSCVKSVGKRLKSLDPQGSYHIRPKELKMSKRDVKTESLEPENDQNHENIKRPKSKGEKLSRT